MRTVNITTDNVKTLGRTYITDNILWLTLSGSGIEFTYTGKNLRITLCGREAAALPGNRDNYARIAVYTDNSRILDEMLDSPEKTYTILDSAITQTISVRLLKLSECAMSLCGISGLIMDDDGILVPAPARARRIEFIGDSITCGYGIDDENFEHHFSTSTEDATKAYAYKTAQALNADCSLFSISGYGIISGYTEEPSVICSQQRIPDYYKSLGFSYDTFDGTLKPEQVLWDFQYFKPDVIVINLGTNDDSYCQDNPERQEQFARAYETFLSVVRQANPQASLFCVLGLMGSRLYPLIGKACQHFREITGDEKLYQLMLPEQDGTIGYVADYHPLECFHDAAAAVLSGEIKKIMNWS